MIKRFPDGTFEIQVPQNLTPEQEHYEFPPRSRFLKQLATAERRTQLASVVENNKPDPSAIDAWFANQQQQQQQTDKERQVVDWITRVEPPPCQSEAGKLYSIIILFFIIHHHNSSSSISRQTVERPYASTRRRRVIQTLRPTAPTFLPSSFSSFFFFVIHYHNSTFQHCRPGPLRRQDAQVPPTPASTGPRTPPQTRGPARPGTAAHGRLPAAAPPRSRRSLQTRILPRPGFAPHGVPARGNQNGPQKPPAATRSCLGRNPVPQVIISSTSPIQIISSSCCSSLSFSILVHSPSFSFFFFRI